MVELLPLRKVPFHSFFSVPFVFLMLFSHQLYGQLVADFSSNIQAGCSPLTVQFINSSSGAVTDYLWDFGNGNTSTLANPGAVYINPGTYTLSLTVSNATNTDTETRTAFITVYQDPLAAFQGDLLTGCAPLNVNFSDLSTAGDGIIDTWLWDFGDGVISSQAAPSHAYGASGSYDVTLVVEDDNGCSSTAILPNYIEVTSPHTVDFDVSTSTPCTLPADIQFTANVTPAGAYTYLWDFGDGNTSTVPNPIHTYTSGGNFSVSLVVKDGGGCQDSIAKVDIVQIEAPTAAFNVLNTISCAGQPVQFVNNSGGADTYLWNFGDGSSSIQATPTHTYLTSGSYTVSLVATNTNQGCSDTLVQNALVTVNNSPTANFSSPNRTGCEVPKLVDFVDSSIDAVDWLWDFGDGNTASAQNPSHNYTAGGNYSVSLVVTNAAGCKDTLIQPSYVQIIPPIAEFVPSPTTGCIPLTVNFLDISSSRDSIVTWIWNFGDGTSSFVQHPTHIYTSVGQYPVSLVVLTQSGCRDTMIYSFIEAGDLPITDFSANPRIVCAEDSVDFLDQSNQAFSWLWSFGDGGFSTQQNPRYQYTDTGTFDVTLISEFYGCTDTAVKENFITVLGPIAEFTLSSATGCQIPYTVSFVDQSTDADGWLWDFGDGTSSTDQNPSHTYTALGSFIVTLIATNSQTGCAYQAERDLDISEPIANFAPDRTFGCTGLAVNFNNTSTGAISYAWDFGDGNISQQASPTHIYRDPGTYNVSLVVTNSAGCTDTVTRVGLITIVGPDGDFTADVTTGCAPLTVQFAATASTFPASESISSYIWDFGDGTTFISQNPTYTYNQVGDYTVSLVLLDSQGCTDTISKQNFISPTFPTAAFSIANNAVCPGAPITFINESTGIGNSYLWDLGDGNTSSAIDPVHIYDTPGSYSITLTATDINGCVHTTFLQDFLNVSPPIANFFAAPTQQACPPLAVNFSDLSSPDVTDWNWNFGDGSTSTLPNPSKIYGIPGSFDVTLTVSNSQGCSDTLRFPDLIELGGPVGSFSFTPKTGCSPLEVNFTAATDSATSWTWDFGDGSLGFGKTVTHVYTEDTIAKPILIVQDTAGCVVALTSSDSVVIQPGPNPAFTTDLTEVCLGQSVNFSENTSSVLPIIQYQWDFGDGNTSLQANPQHLYTQAGNYQVSLVVTSLNGCVDTAISTLPLSVKEPPTAAFTPSDLQGCMPVDISFLDQSTSINGISNYLWIFGDGDSANIPFPVHTFDSVGNYRVILEVEDNLGCKDSLSQVVSIAAPPVADFTSSSQIGCAPREIQFSDLSSGVAVITDWFWDFGDGNTATEQHPIHTYAINGIYSVSLTVTDANGCIHTEFKLEYIELANPEVDFTSNATLACPPQSVQFSISVNTQAPITNYFWDFGDSTTSTLADPAHVFYGADTFDVSVIVINSLGCADTLVRPQYVQNYSPPIAAFDLSDSALCVPATLALTSTSMGGSSPITSYLYDFGNGDTASTPIASYQYTDAGIYQLSLIVTDFNGCKDTTQVPFSVNPALTANFGFSDSLACTTTMISFFDLSTGQNAPIEWYWDFGDGDSSSAQFPVHTYLNNGSYTVGLKVVDGNGCSDSLSRDNVIAIDGPNVDFISNVQNICPDEPVLFTDVTTAPSSIIDWYWDFGDGTTSMDQNPVHSYQNPGLYTIILTVTDSLGCVISQEQPNFIEVIEGPTAAFTVSDTIGCVPLVVNLQDQSTVGAVPIASLNWDFGNGSTATGATPSAFFSTAGMYDIQLVTIGANGCTDTATVQVNVLPPPVAAFQANDTVGCAPKPIVFSDLSTSAAPIDRWEWDFGDGNTSTEQFPTHTYQQNGIYDVKLRITDVNGCMDSLSIIEYIKLENPVADFAPEVDEACPGTPIQFNDGSNGSYAITSWLWNFGDSTEASAQNPLHIYETAGLFTVSLTITDTLGCSDTITKIDTIQIFQGPTPEIALSDSVGCPPLQVAFSDNSRPNDAEIVAWNWRLGNGDTAILPLVDALYPSTGSYVAQLVVTDANGCVDSVNQNIEVYERPTADFVVPIAEVCAYEPMNFVDISTGSAPIAIWEWAFGDSTQSDVQNPTHTYTDNGRYNVSLIIEDTYGCRDSVLKLAVVDIIGPEANFEVNETVGCMGQLFSFSDLSNSDIPIASWNWDFGDGDSASVQNPSHTFLSPGTYDIRLAVLTEEGCVDTLLLPEYVEIRPGPEVQFATSDTAACAPLVAAFTDNSIGSDSIVAWQWFVDGVASGLSQNMSQLFEVAGTYDIRLRVTDQRGCQGEGNQIVNVFENPTADFVASDTVGCAPSNIVFNDRSSPIPVDWAWSFGDSTFSANQNPVHTYEEDGRYTVSLKIIDRNGCVDSVTKNQYIQLRHPEGDFAVDYEPGCPPIDAAFIAVAESIYGIAALNWDFGDGQQGSGMEVTHVYADTGSYDVTLYVTDSLGCMQIITKPSFVHIQGNERPIPVGIHWATVEDDDQIKLMYRGYGKDDFAAYQVYREAPTASGNWQLVYRSEFVDDTVFIDVDGLNTLENTYCYKVTIVNQCGEESLLAAAEKHCTIEVKAAAEPDRIFVEWNDYLGWEVEAYEVYRVQSYSTANIELLVTVPGFSQSYIDSSAICKNNYHYRVKAIGFSEGQISWSDTTTARSSQSQAVEPSEIFRVSVQNNRALLVEWLPFDDREAEVIYIEKRSDKETTWSIAGRVNPGTLSYLDTLVDVSRESYSYRLHAIDSCGGSYPYSNIAASILLKLSPKSFSSDLFWTGYQGWELGVSRYEIEIFDETLGVWKILAVVQDGDTTYTDDTQALNQANMCYRIRAFEQGGNGANSLSNEVCRPVVPDLYAPNAFSPNSDNINDEFYLEGLYIVDFHLRIFNRWGQLVFETQNIEEAWDGKFNGRSVPEGVYVFVAKGKGFLDAPFELSGTVSLIR